MLKQQMFVVASVLSWRRLSIGKYFELWAQQNSAELVKTVEQQTLLQDMLQILFNYLDLLQSLMKIGFCHWKAIPFDIFQLIVSELIKFLDIQYLLQIYTDLVPLTWKLIFKFLSQRKSYVCKIFNGERVAVHFITAALQILFPFGSDRMLFLSMTLSKSIRKDFSYISAKLYLHSFSVLPVLLYVGEISSQLYWQ